MCGPRDIRLKLAYCGICGTDLHEYASGPILCTGKDQINPISGARLPQILGHEFSGTIIEVGEEVSELVLGQRVCVNPAMDDRHHGLETCESCRKGWHNICYNSTFYGINAQGSGFAEEIVVKSQAVVPLPHDVSLKLAALAEPLAVASHMVRISGFQQGHDAVVFGAGPIGSAITLILRTKGARTIIVSEIAESRQRLAEVAGATRIMNPLKENIVEVVQATLGRGSDIAFEACGLQQTLDEAIACVKPGGCIFNVAIREEPVQIDLNLLTLPEKRLVAGNAYTAEDFQSVMHVLSTKKSEVESLISSVVSLERAIEEGFSKLLQDRGGHNKILVQMSPD